MIEFNLDILSKRIKELRVQLNMYQKTLGEKVGVERNTIAMYETGKSRPSFEVLVRLAQIFGTTTDYLLGLTDFE